MLSLVYFCIICIGLTVQSYETTTVVCRDENGAPVDWYYMYKLPRDYSSRSVNESQTEGVRYLYITSSTASEGWKLSEHTINELTSLPGQTLSFVINSNDTVLIAYNDEAPDGVVNFQEGHTKGVIAADSTTGFWLVHSVPKYPNMTQYDYPKTGHNYGQSFLCVSLSYKEIDTVGKQQLYNEPNIYYSRIPNQFRDKYPNLVLATEKQWRHNSPYWNYVELTSLDGIKFETFAKGRKFKKELYEDWIAPTLNSDLLVESWRHGPGILPTNCTRKQRVMNIEAISKPDLDLSFHTTKDHSKWCVDGMDDANWICVGDINRAERQLSRGGGTVCQHNKLVAMAYRNLVASVEPCPSKE